MVFNGNFWFRAENIQCISGRFIFGLTDLLDYRGRLQSELKLSDKLCSLWNNPKPIRGMLKAEIQENTLWSSHSHQSTP